MRRAAWALLFGVAAAAPPLGCTFLVGFDDSGPVAASADASWSGGDDGPPPDALAEDDVASADAAMRDAPADEGASGDAADALFDDARPPVPDAARPDAGPPRDAGACSGRPDGYNWNRADHEARCCGGEPVRVTDKAHCGACGIACTGASTCELLQGHYFCTCRTSPECWSGCCSAANGVCTASLCSNPACDPKKCTGGSRCNEYPGHSFSDYCDYP